MRHRWPAVLVVLSSISPGFAQTGQSRNTGLVQVPTLANPELLDKGDIMDDAVQTASCGEAYNYQASANQRALFARIKRAIGKVQNGVNAASWFGVPHSSVVSASFNAYDQVAALGFDGPTKLQAIAEAGEEASAKYTKALNEYKVQLDAWQMGKDTWDLSNALPFTQEKPEHPAFPLSPVYADVLDQVYHDLFDIDARRPDRKSRFGVEGRKYASKNGKYLTYMAFKRLIDNYELCGAHDKPSSVERWRLVRKIDEFKRILARNVDTYIKEEVLKKNPVETANALVQQSTAGTQTEPSANKVP